MREVLTGCQFEHGDLWPNVRFGSKADIRASHQCKGWGPYKALIPSMTVGRLMTPGVGCIFSLKPVVKSCKIATSSPASTTHCEPVGKRYRQKFTMWEIAPNCSPSSKNIR